VGAAVTLDSESLYRGYSLSAGRPTASLDVSYDSPSGFYASASGSLVAARSEGIRPLGLQLSGGYARSLSNSVSLDVGLTRSSYTDYSGLYGHRSYTEIYAGVTTKLLSSHIYYSPRALVTGKSTLYAEANGNLGGYSGFSAQAHAGLLVPLADYQGKTEAPHLDWRLGASRAVGRLTLRAAVSGGGPGRSSYGGSYAYPHAHRFTFGVTCAL
jgi:uncharacterized protein (TIGR02001 family)